MWPFKSKEKTLSHVWYPQSLYDYMMSVTSKCRIEVFTSAKNNFFVTKSYHPLSYDKIESISFTAHTTVDGRGFSSDRAFFYINGAVDENKSQEIIKEVNAYIERIEQGFRDKEDEKAAKKIVMTDVVSLINAKYQHIPAEQIGAEYISITINELSAEQRENLIGLIRTITPEAL